MVPQRDQSGKPKRMYIHIISVNPLDNLIQYSVNTCLCIIVYIYILFQFDYFRKLVTMILSQSLVLQKCEFSFYLNVENVNIFGVGLKEICINRKR